MTELVTRRSEKQKLIDGIKKTPMYHRLVVDLVEMYLDDARRNYEDTAPASECLRGQLVSLKALHKDLTNA